MHIEIHKPELERRMRQEIESGHFHDMDELIEKAWTPSTNAQPPLRRARPAP